MDPVEYRDLRGDNGAGCKSPFTIYLDTLEEDETLKRDKKIEILLSLARQIHITCTDLEHANDILSYRYTHIKALVMSEEEQQIAKIKDFILHGI